MMKLIQTNPYISLMRIAWQYARDHKGRYVLIYSLFIFNSLLSALEPIIWGLFVNQVQQHGSEIIYSAWMYALAYVLIKFVSWCAHGPGRVMEEKLAFTLGKNFMEELYQRALDLPIKWHQDHHSGSIIDRINKAYSSLRQFFAEGFMYLYSIGSFIISFGAILYFSPLFGGIACVLGIGVIVIILKFDKPYIQHLTQKNEKEHIVSSTLFDSLSNIITVITLKLEKRMQKGLTQKIMDVFSPFRKSVLINEWKWFTVDMCVAFIYGLLILGYIYQNYIPGEVFLLGGLVTLVGYIKRFTSVFHEITWQYSVIVRYNTNVGAANEIIDSYDSLSKDHGNIVLPNTWKHIHIKDLDFYHSKPIEGKMVQGLKGIDLEIQRGSKIALIGESGSGKSTLLALMRGLYTLDNEINLHVDGQRFSDIKALSNATTLFPQEPEIFENTIAYNISLGLNYELADLREICEDVQFWSVIDQLPNGLDSSIQEKGVNLSGGQKQRLALARGVFAARDSSLILLDEPTSSVDPKTELSIYQKLFKRFKDKALVSALHRMHLLPYFDKIYILENGEIVDQGSFSELHGKSPKFMELWRHQEEEVAMK